MSKYLIYSLRKLVWNLLQQRRNKSRKRGGCNLGLLVPLLSGHFPFWDLEVIPKRCWLLLEHETSKPGGLSAHVVSSSSIWVITLVGSKDTTGLWFPFQSSELTKEWNCRDWCSTSCLPGFGNLCSCCLTSFCSWWKTVHQTLYSNKRNVETIWSLGWSYLPQKQTSIHSHQMAGAWLISSHFNATWHSLVNKIRLDQLPASKSGFQLPLLQDDLPFSEKLLQAFWDPRLKWWKVSQTQHLGEL